MSNEAVGVLLSGLIGAILGALIGARVAVVIATRQIRASQTLQRRDELRDVVAQFWGASDLLWESKEDLGWTVYQMQIDRQAGTSAERQNELELRRQNAFAAIASAEREARRAIAIMRLLFPELVDSAQKLFAASQQNLRIQLEGGDMGLAVKDARQGALESFERTATSSLKAYGKSESEAVARV